MSISFKKILLPLIFIFQNLCSQKINNDYVIKIAKVSEKIILDGQLKESMWETADVADNFSMILPQDDRKATQFSEIRMAYDDKNIYIAVIFFNN